MTDGSSPSARWNSAPPEAIYRAFTHPVMLETWQAPADMAGSVHSFDDRVGGGYQMSLSYPAAGTTPGGEPAIWEDRYTAHLLESVFSERIATTIIVDTTDPDFSEERTMVMTLKAEAQGTTVPMIFDRTPPGLQPRDNEAGTRSSLEQPARHVEHGTA